MKTLISFLLLLSFNAQASELLIQYAPKELNGKTYMSLGYNFRPFKAEWFRLEAVGALRNDNVLTLKDLTFIAEFSPTIELRPSFVYARFGSGIAIISRKDRYLNSYYQFATTAAIGIRWKGVSLGYLFKHYSNGSSSPQNRGWNFKGVEIRREF